MVSIQSERKCSMLRTSLAEVLRRETDNPLLKEISIIKVSLDSAIATANISFQTSNSNKLKVEKALNRAAGFLQNRVGRVLKLRRTPKLRFFYDQGLDRAQKIEDILHSLGSA